MKQHKLWKRYEKTLPPFSTRLGCFYDDEIHTAIFSIWAPSAKKVRVFLFEDGSTDQISYKFPLIVDTKTGVWTLRCSVDVPLDAMFYEYEIVNEKGTFRCLDPYAVSMAAFTNDNSSGRAAIINLRSPACLPPGGWSEESPHAENLSHLPPFTHYTDAIIYEVSVRDFTISPDAQLDRTSFEVHPGSYNAFVQKLPYIKNLGVTHIQLLPVLNFYNNDETKTSFEKTSELYNNNYNWGYDPHNYFTPEGWYASNPRDPYCRIRELKNLIKEAHAHGLRVILDVVYNHMAKADFLDDIVPSYYFRLSKHDGSFLSNSGCGNDIATERQMVRKLIHDSLVYFTKDYHVDGFRFDLMGLIDTKTILDAYDACVLINKNILFIGEGWKMYNGEKGTIGMDQNFMKQTHKVSVFNDEFRDLAKGGGMNEDLKAFLTSGTVSTKQVFFNAAALPQVNFSVNSPARCVQYFECHDGLSLHDSIVHNLNLDFSNTNHVDELYARLRLSHVLLFTSQGIPFIQAGQENARTKPKELVQNIESSDIHGNFVRNSYKSSDRVNQFSWDLDSNRLALNTFIKTLIALRKKFPHFRLHTKELVEKSLHFLQSQSSDLLLVYSISLEHIGIYEKAYLIFNARKTISSIDLDIDFSRVKVYVHGEKVSPEAFSFEQSTYSGKGLEIGPLSACVFFVSE